MESGDAIGGDEVEQLFDELHLKRLQRRANQQQELVNNYRIVGMGGNVDDGFELEQTGDGTS